MNEQEMRRRRKIQLEENNNILGELNMKYSTYDHDFMLELLSKSFGDHWVYFSRGEGDEEFMCFSWDEIQDLISAFLEDESAETFWEAHQFDVPTTKKIRDRYPGLAEKMPKYLEERL